MILPFDLETKIGRGLPIKELTHQDSRSHPRLELALLQGIIAAMGLLTLLGKEGTLLLGHTMKDPLTIRET